MAALRALITGIAMSLYSLTLLKIYLDMFLSRPNKVRRLAGWLPFAAWQFLSEIIVFPGHITMPLTFLTIVWTGLTAYTGRRWKRWVFPTVYMAVWVFLEGAVSFVAVLVCRDYWTRFIIISITSKILLLPVVLGIMRFARRKGISREPYSGGGFFLALPITGMVLYHMLYSLLHGLYLDRFEVGLWLFITALALLVLNLSFYPCYAYLVRSLHIRKNVNFYQKQMELFKQEKAMEEMAATEIHQMRHDMKQKFLYLDGLARDENLVALQEALAELLGETSERGRLESRTGNMAADALVNHAWKAAEASGIIFHGNIAGGLPELSITDGDLCVLVGNALDNALEASENILHGEKEVWVSLEYMDGYLIFQVANRYEGEITQTEDGNIPSRKAGNGHGLGLYSMERIVHKYHGRMDIKYADGIFTVEILIYC